MAKDECTRSPLPDGFWCCGRCGSVMPVTFWHRCDEQGTHTAPHEDPESWRPK